MIDIIIVIIKKIKHLLFCYRSFKLIINKITSSFRSFCVANSSCIVCSDSYSVTFYVNSGVVGSFICESNITRVWNIGSYSNSSTLPLFLKCHWILSISTSSCCSSFLIDNTIFFSSINFCKAVIIDFNDFSANCSSTIMFCVKGWCFSEYFVLLS